MVVLIVGTLPFQLRILGGGDVKLMAACACVFGLAQLVPFVLYTALVGGVVGLAAMGLRRMGRLDPDVRVPYAVAIAGGVAWLGLSLTFLPKLNVI
jgi:prepilin peptidase CpaA